MKCSRRYNVQFLRAHYTISPSPYVNMVHRKFASDTFSVLNLCTRMPTICTMHTLLCSFIQRHFFITSLRVTTRLKVNQDLANLSQKLVFLGNINKLSVSPHRLFCILYVTM